MIRIYNTEELENFNIQQESKSWFKSGIISELQWKNIQQQFPTKLYQPPIFLRIVLFIATTIGISFITGLVGVSILSENQNAAPFLSLIYGIGLFIFLEKGLILNSNHYKNGTTDAILYAGTGFVCFGIFDFFDYNDYVIILTILLISILFTLRYVYTITVISGLGAVLMLFSMISNDIGGIAMHILPFTLCGVSIGIYFLAQNLKPLDWNRFYKTHFIIAECISLVMIYLSLNYFVVRELSIELLHAEILEGQNIPFAYFFYITTLGIPVFYFVYGLKTKSMLFIRTSLMMFAFGVFTFKYYFSLGHPEISMTIAGAILLFVSIRLMQYLKEPKNGFTRELILKNNVANANLEAFIINNTMSVNAPTDISPAGQGGEFGGGGTSSDF